MTQNLWKVSVSHTGDKESYKMREIDIDTEKSHKEVAITGMQTEKDPKQSYQRQKSNEKEEK